MKKTVLSIALALVAGGMLAACSSKDKASDTDSVVEQEEVVGEVIDMPAEGSQAADTTIATAEAVAVDTAQAH